MSYLTGEKKKETSKGCPNVYVLVVDVTRVFLCYSHDFQLHDSKSIELYSLLQMSLPTQPIFESTEPLYMKVKMYTGSWFFQSFHRKKCDTQTVCLFFFLFISSYFSFFTCFFLFFATNDSIRCRRYLPSDYLIVYFLSLLLFFLYNYSFNISSCHT